MVACGGLWWIVVAVVAVAVWNQAVAFVVVAVVVV